MKPMPEYNPSLHYLINLHNALECLREQAEENPFKMQNDGICLSISKWLECKSSLNLCQRKAITNKLDSLIAQWPEHNGDENWPVGGGLEYAHEQSNFTLWKNPRRLELLDFLIEELSK